MRLQSQAASDDEMYNKALRIVPHPIYRQEAEIFMSGFTRQSASGLAAECFIRHLSRFSFPHGDVHDFSFVLLFFSKLLIIGKHKRSCK